MFRLWGSLAGKGKHLSCNKKNIKLNKDKLKFIFEYFSCDLIADQETIIDVDVPPKNAFINSLLTISLLLTAK